MILSKDNSRIKLLQKLKLKKYRDSESLFLVFGDHLITEAKKHGVVLEVYTSNPSKGGTLISKDIMSNLNYTETPFDTLAVCKKLEEKELTSLILVLEDVQDPDNVGALLRSASAFGFETVILSNKCADIYNDKTIRASKGALFHLNIIRSKDIIDTVSNLGNEGYSIYTTDLNASKSLELKEKSILVLGNEGQGISVEMSKLANYNLVINTKNVESLNVSVAGAILMYEWSKL